MPVCGGVAGTGVLPEHEVGVGDDGEEEPALLARLERSGHDHVRLLLRQWLEREARRGAHLAGNRRSINA
eukprot:8456-Eustigmatos_ZCMA.PRE.1